MHEDQLNPPTETAVRETTQANPTNVWSELKQKILTGKSPKDIKAYIELNDTDFKKEPSLEHIEKVMQVVKIAAKNNSNELYKALCDSGLVTKAMFNFLSERDKVLGDFGEPHPVSDNIKEAKRIARGLQSKGLEIDDYFRIIYTPQVSGGNPIAPDPVPTRSRDTNHQSRL